MTRVGDLNSAADWSTAPAGRRLTSAAFTDPRRLDGDHPGPTCCQQPDLGNPASTLASRIDYVLVRGGLDAVEVHLVGDRSFRDRPPPWLSDHAGAVATLALG